VHEVRDVADDCTVLRNGRDVAGEKIVLTEQEVPPAMRDGVDGDIGVRGSYSVRFAAGRALEDERALAGPDEVADLLLFLLAVAGSLQIGHQLREGVPLLLELLVLDQQVLVLDIDLRVAVNLEGQRIELVAHDDDRADERDADSGAGFAGRRLIQHGEMVAEGGRRRERRVAGGKRQRIHCEGAAAR